MLLGLNFWQWVITTLLLTGMALPFLQIAHPRHARAFMFSLVGFTVLWLFLYLLFIQQMHGGLAQHNLDTVLVRSYVFSVALCSLLEEVLSMRDESRAVRPVVLSLFITFFLLTLCSLLGGVFAAF